MFRFQDEFCTVTTSLPANTPIVEKQKHPRTSKCISNKSIKKYRIVIFLRACRMKVFFSQFSPIAVSCVWTEFKYSFCNDHCVRPPEPGPPPPPRPAPPRPLYRGVLLVHENSKASWSPLLFPLEIWAPHAWGSIPKARGSIAVDFNRHVTPFLLGSRASA